MIIARDSLVSPELEADLDFPALDMLLWQVFGISDFLTNEILTFAKTILLYW